MTPDKPGLRPFSALTADQLAQVITIYREAFEAPWEWPPEQIAGLANAGPLPAAGCALALVDNAAAIGLAVASYLPAANLAYLHYLAVAPARRGAGSGAILLHAVQAAGEDWAKAADRSGCRGALIEAEMVDGPPPGADRTLRQRRIAFYQRHGAALTGVCVPRPPWALPEMPDWAIMLLPGTAWAGDLTPAVTRELCLALMVEGYGIAADAPWLHTWPDHRKATAF